MVSTRTQVQRVQRQGAGSGTWQPNLALMRASRLIKRRITRARAEHLREKAAAATAGASRGASGRRRPPPKATARRPAAAPPPPEPRLTRSRAAAAGMRAAAAAAAPMPAGRVAPAPPPQLPRPAVERRVTRAAAAAAARPAAAPAPQWRRWRQQLTARHLTARGGMAAAPAPQARWPRELPAEQRRVPGAPPRMPVRPEQDDAAAAPAQGPTGRCSVCMMSPLQLIDVSVNCNHAAAVCRTCSCTYVAGEVYSARTAVRCPMPACRAEMEDEDIHRLLPHLLQRLQHSRLQAYLATAADVVRCPFSGCNGAQWTAAPEQPGSSGTCTRVRCPQCANDACRAHKLPWAVCLQCNPLEGRPGPVTRGRATQAAGASETSASLAAISGACNYCAKCGMAIEKNGGCNHMVCRCGNDFMWTDRQRQ